MSTLNMRSEQGFFNNHKFIKLVHQIPMLWDMQCADYRRSKEQKLIEWAKIGKQFRLTGAQAAQKWIYTKEKYRKERTKSDKRWPLYDALRFLDINPVVKRFRTDQADVEQAIQKFDINRKQSAANITGGPSNNRIFLHNSLSKRYETTDDDLITPIVVSIATTDRDNDYNDDKPSPSTMANVWPDDTAGDENGFMSDDSTSPPNDYKSRCRAFAKYLGEELCLMNESTGDALITDMLKIIVEEKCKK